MSERIRFYTYRVSYLVSFNWATINSEPVFFHSDIIRAKSANDAKNVVKAKYSDKTPIFLSAPRSPGFKVDGITSIKLVHLTKRQVTHVLQSLSAQDLEERQHLLEQQRKPQDPWASTSGVTLAVPDLYGRTMPTCSPFSHSFVTSTATVPMTVATTPLDLTESDVPNEWNDSPIHLYESDKECPDCGQIPDPTITGEHHCSTCGMPRMYDDKTLINILRNGSVEEDETHKPMPLWLEFFVYIANKVKNLWK